MQLGVERPDPPGQLAGREPAARFDRETGRVVAPVLEPRQRAQQDRGCLALSRVSDDTTHRSAISFAGLPFEEGRERRIQPEARELRLLGPHLLPHVLGGRAHEIAAARAQLTAGPAVALAGTSGAALTVPAAPAALPAA